MKQDVNAITENIHSHVEIILKAAMRDLKAFFGKEITENFEEIDEKLAKLEKSVIIGEIVKKFGV
jgi:hypothetical protein